MKTSKQFSFTHPLTIKKVRDLKVVTERVGALTIKGIGYCNRSISRVDPFERWTVDIEEVTADCSLMDVLSTGISAEDIEDAAVRYVAQLFDTAKVA
jgi:hypothetical protein